MDQSGKTADSFHRACLTTIENMHYCKENLMLEIVNSKYLRKTWDCLNRLNKVLRHLNNDNYHNCVITISKFCGTNEYTVDKWDADIEDINVFLKWNCEQKLVSKVCEWYRYIWKIDWVFENWIHIWIQ